MTLDKLETAAAAPLKRKLLENSRKRRVTLPKTTTVAIHLAWVSHRAILAVMTPEANPMEVAMTQ